jgi:hypothetical protein
MARGHTVRQVYMYAACCFCPISTDLQLSLQILIKLRHTKLGKNPCNGSRVAACERKCGQTDMAKLVVGFRMPKKTGNEKNGSYSYHKTTVKPTSVICGDLSIQ